MGHKVRQTNDGGYIIVGATDSYGAGNFDFYMIKTDALGEVMWERTFGGTGADQCVSVDLTNDGGYVLGGYTQSYGSGSYDYWVVKTDANGLKLWDLPIGGSGADYAMSVKQTTDGGYIVLGHTFSYGAGNADFLLVRFNSEIEIHTPPTIRWTLPYGGANDDYGMYAIETTDGNLMLVGETSSSGAGYYDVWIIKTNADGDPLWTRTWGTSGHDCGYCALEIHNNACMISGFTGYLASVSQPKAFLLMMSATGDTVWSQLYGNGWEEFYEVQPTSDGYYICPGVTTTNSAGNFDYWLVKTHGPVGTIAGSVSLAYANLIVDLFQNNTLVTSSLTDANGNYSFADLEPDIYTVALVVPLGFSVNQNDVQVDLTAGETENVNFTLTPIITTNTARSKGYWKHQVNANGNTDYSTAEMEDLAQEIFDHFYVNPINPIAISGVTYVGNPAQPLNISNLQYMLNINQGGTTMYLKACQQYLTLLLNLASNKVGQYTLASANGVTHSQAVVYINDLLTAPGTNYELAKNIAETLNDAQMVSNGVIPLSTPNVIFGEGMEILSILPKEFGVSAFPNPFNPSTAISYQLQASSYVSLNVYNTAGRLVQELVNGWREEGNHEVVFDGSNLSSGVYLYTLTAGNHRAAGKMLLLK